MRSKKIYSYILISSLFFFTYLYAQPSDWQGKIEIKNDIEYVHNPEQGLWENDPTKKITIEKIFSLGSLEAPEKYLFSWVSAIITDSDNNIYACDSKEHRVQVYDQNGKYLRTIGREGHGPGDLMRLRGIGIGKDGRIFVQDDLNYRISIFKPGGDFDHSFRYNGFVGEYLEFDSKGNVLLYHLPRYRADEERLPIVTAYDMQGKIVAEYGKRLKLMDAGPFGRPWYAFNGFVMQSDGVLLVMFNYPYLIHFFKNGQLLKVVTRNVSTFTEPEIVAAEFKTVDGRIDMIKKVVQRGSLKNIFTLPDGRFIVIIEDGGSNFRTAKDYSATRLIIDLFTKDGYFLKSYDWNWEQKGFIAYIDAQGYFYTNIGDSEIVPGVTKWRISFE